MLTLNDGRSELWQWDTGRTLTVDADCSQVHFSNKVFGRSIDVDVLDGVAIIPDVLLQTDKELTAWAFVGATENGYTKISKTFKVNRRNKPANYVFTPPDQTSLEEIKEKVEYLESVQDPDAIKNAVEDYLANNPIEIDETDPTVPEWAKQPTKPSYTASEVGALPADTVIPTIPDNVSAFRNDAGYLTEHQDLTGYATEKYVQGYAQPKGDYLTEVPDAYATKEFVTNKIAEAELGGEEVDLSGYAQKSELPTKVSQLENDSGYLTEHQDISGKLDANKLPEAINTALAQAKASGEFDGKDGKDGADGKNGTSVTVTKVTESTEEGGSNVVEFSDGKTLTVKNGRDGGNGDDGKTPVFGVDYWTETDKANIIQQVLTELGAIPVYGTIDKNNNIYLTALMENGTYYLKYADADGNVTDICTYTHNYVPKPSYKNLFVAETCTINKRNNSSGGTSPMNGCFVTDFIDIGDAMASGGTNVLHYKGMYFKVASGDNVGSCYSFITYYKADKTFLGQDKTRSQAEQQTADGDYIKTLNANYTAARYIRVTAVLEPYTSDTHTYAALTSKDQLANCKLALNETITD